MKYLNITLSVKRKAFRADSPHPPGTDKVYFEARKKALARDKHTCRFCGIRCKRNEVHHLNDDHEDHSDNNLVTACVLCHMCFHISFAGIRNRGKLIYLPEATIGQGELNQLVRQLWVAEAMGDGDMKSMAGQLLSRLDKADILANTVLGTSKAAVMGDFLASMSDEDYAQRAKGLAGVYLLPVKEAYGPYIKSWIEDCAQFKPTDWVLTAKTKFEQWSAHTT